MGHRAVIIYGDPAYYRRFGFRPAEEFDICTADGMYAAALQVLEMWPGSMEGVHGRFFESPAFEVDVLAAEAFDKSFPPQGEAGNALPTRLFAPCLHAQAAPEALKARPGLCLTQISRPVRVRRPCPARAFLL